VAVGRERGAGGGGGEPGAGVLRRDGEFLQVGRPMANVFGLRFIEKKKRKQQQNTWRTTIREAAAQLPQATIQLKKIFAAEI
jgi:hypothetical protein